MSSRSATPARPFSCKSRLATFGVHVLVRVSLLLMTAAEQLARVATVVSPTPTLDEMLREVASEYRDIVSSPGGDA
jgi:hypothetical protein